MKRGTEAGAAEGCPRSLRLLRWALGLIVLGVLNGGLGDACVKAVNICAECIGLG